METLNKIARRFKIESDVAGIEPLGNGLINDTFLVRTVGADAPDYVLQRVNTAIFKDVDLLQENLKKISEHIRSKGGVSLTVVPALDGSLYVEDDGKFWRMTIAIADSHPGGDVNPAMAREAGRAFAKFHSYFTGSDVPELGETIPDFHNTELRIAQLREAVAADRAGRAAEVSEVTERLLAREEEMTLAQRLGREGKLPRRVTHCDTKLSNILFDREGKVICIIDLDTTMPGFVLSDFGDFIRTAGNTGAEDDRDLSRVGVDMDIYRSYLEGYLGGADFLTDTERELLPFGAKMLTYMQAVRFLTDYINGDTYYKIQYPEHNLVRTLAQMKLLQSLDENI